MVATAPPTARGRARRDLLLHATADLVAARGFHGVGIAEIGAAAGVSGSAIYRHFASKEEMLAAVLDRVVDDLLDGARAVADDPRALDALVERHVAFALADGATITVWAREAVHLTGPDRRRLRRRQRAYADVWTDVVLRERPDLDRAAARVVVHAVFGLLNSVADYDARVPGSQVASLLTSAALAAVRSSPGRPRP
jgi:AcrR family transcriptional regulator